MSKTTCILFIPGVGKSEKYDKNAKIMGDALGYPYEVVNWQADIESLVNDTRDLHQSYGAYSAKKGKKGLYDVCCDATAYDMYGPKTMIRVRSTYVRLSEKYDNIIIIAHSFGTVIAYDFLSFYQPANITKFVTLGCPIPMFKLDNYHRLPGVQWVNIWEKSDAIAHQLFKEGIADIRLQAGIKGFWLFSHFSYLKSPKCARIIKEELRI